MLRIVRRIFRDDQPAPRLSARSSQAHFKLLPFDVATLTCAGEVADSPRSFSAEINKSDFMALSRGPAAIASIGSVANSVTRLRA